MNSEFQIDYHNSQTNDEPELQSNAYEIKITGNFKDNMTPEQRNFTLLLEYQLGNHSKY